MGNWLSIDAAGKDVRGYLAVPESGSGPGILVCHAWWGLTDYFVEQCDRLANEGFVVLAADMHQGATTASVDEAEVLVTNLTSDHAEAVLRASLDTLLARPEVSKETVGVVGYSMGAAWSLYLSTIRPREIAAVVVYYGAYALDFSAATASYLGHFAPGDEWEPDEGVHETETALQAAGCPVTFHWYKGVGHWFAEDNRPTAYDPEAASLAWQRTLDFLHQHLD